jgi:hypothetical protein
MDASKPTASWFERTLVPSAVLCGAVIAFAACCAVGHRAGDRNLYTRFTRFHFLIAPESLYYPTVNQVRQLALAKLDPAKIAVIIGGSSIFHGTGQAPGDVWTDELQRQLGSEYCVLNLGLRSAFTGEFGAVAAEVLQKDIPRLILVSDVTPMALPPADGLRARYFYCDAQARGLLMDHPFRDKTISDRFEQMTRYEHDKGRAAARAAFATMAEETCELQSSMQFDRWLAFRDLWTGIAYRRLATIWTPATKDQFTRPRALYVDPETGARPLAVRFDSADEQEASLKQLRRYLELGYGTGASPGLNLSQGRQWRVLEERIDAYFPPDVRSRTLLAVMRSSPVHVSQLSAREQDWYRQVLHKYVDVIAAHGLQAIEIGGDYDPGDYADSRHLSPSGGRRLAAELAPRIRAMATAHETSKASGR